MVAVQITALTIIIPILLFTRFLEGLSTASSAPASLGLLSSETQHSDALRGRVMAAFELATVAGLTLGTVVGGILFDRLGQHCFWVIAAIYALAALVFGLVRGHRRATTQPHLNARRFVAALGQRKVLIFAPAWIAINAVLGVWMTHAPYQLTGKAPLPDQFLTGGFSGTQVGMVFGGFAVAFVAGIWVWGLLFARFRRTTIMLVSLAGTFAIAALIFAVNHSGGDPAAIVPAVALGIVALGVASGFTPASLGFLAEIAEASPEDRGTIMGLYSVFLGAGQLVGGAVGGIFALRGAVDGLVVLTLLLGLLALITVVILRREEGLVEEAAIHRHVAENV
jgi:MFS family permease